MISRDKKIMVISAFFTISIPVHHFQTASRKAGAVDTLTIYKNISFSRPKICDDIVCEILNAAVEY